MRLLNKIEIWPNRWTGKNQDFSFFIKIFRFCRDFRIFEISDFSRFLLVYNTTSAPSGPPTNNPPPRSNEFWPLGKVWGQFATKQTEAPTRKSNTEIPNLGGYAGFGFKKWRSTVRSQVKRSLLTPGGPHQRAFGGHLDLIADILDTACVYSMSSRVLEKDNRCLDCVREISWLH